MVHLEPDPSPGIKPPAAGLPRATMPNLTPSPTWCQDSGNGVLQNERYTCRLNRKASNKEALRRQPYTPLRRHASESSSAMPVSYSLDQNLSSQMPSCPRSAGSCKSSSSMGTLNPLPRDEIVMWVSSPATPEGRWDSVRVCLARARGYLPGVKTVGQCLFGLAMLLLMAGIALCIWGFVGTAIPPFQIAGPLCLGIGLLIYAMGCVLCCRERPVFSGRLEKEALRHQTRQALRVLERDDVIRLIQDDPSMYSDFRQLSHGIFHLQNKRYAGLVVLKSSSCIPSPHNTTRSFSK